jgi:nitrogen regulatory protein P-II 1
MVDIIKSKSKLLITIVNKGTASKVVRASKRAGCEGGTILPGKGTGHREHTNFLGLTFSPEKEVVFSIVNEDKAEHILNAISKTAKLGKPGNGVAFILNLKSVTGIAHLLEDLTQKS